MASLNQGLRDLQLVVFRLGNEMFGIEIGAVKEIITWQPITRIPEAPAFVEGIINLRGQLIPITDLRKRLGFKAAVSEKQSRILVIEQDQQVVGLMVDAVSEVLRVPVDRIEPADTLMTGLRLDLMKGIVKTDSSLIVLLDPTTLLPTDAASA